LAQSASGATRFEFGEGTRVYYRVREQLVGISFLNDAVGVTDGISGAIVTTFSFSKFNLTTPELPFLLTVEDEIRLEIDFKVSRS
jgi:hypothetical protein